MPDRVDIKIHGQKYVRFYLIIVQRNAHIVCTFTQVFSSLWTFFYLGNWFYRQRAYSWALKVLKKVLIWLNYRHFCETTPYLKNWFDASSIAWKSSVYNSFIWPYMLWKWCLEPEISDMISLIVWVLRNNDIFTQTQSCHNVKISPPNSLWKKDALACWRQRGRKLSKKGDTQNRTADGPNDLTRVP